MNKIVVFTAIVGNYDVIKQPMVVDDRFDYILFSNDIAEKQIGVWQVRSIPYYNDIQTKIARWVKTHPEELLSEYSCSLWLDASILVASSNLYDRCIELYNKNIPLASVQHPERHCLYDEGVLCMLAQLETETIVLPWFCKIHKEGYPHDHGLTETGILFRIHAITSHFDQLWWQCIEQYSRRDQLSFDYVLWKCDIECGLFLLNGENARNSEWVRININHNNPTHRTLTMSPKQFPFLYHYKALFPYQDYWNHNFNAIYSKIYTRRFPLLKARILGLFYYLWLNIWKPLKAMFKT